MREAAVVSSVLGAARTRAGAASAASARAASSIASAAASSAASSTDSSAASSAAAPPRPSPDDASFAPRFFLDAAAARWMRPCASGSALCACFREGLGARASPLVRPRPIPAAASVHDGRWPLPPLAHVTARGDRRQPTRRVATMTWAGRAATRRARAESADAAGLHEGTGARTNMSAVEHVRRGERRVVPRRRLGRPQHATA